MLKDADLVIVGAGFYGATLAEQLAQKQRKVLVIDSRPHIGGNAYSEIDGETGIERHVYGAHLFHTPNSRVWSYLQNFTTFTDYKHRVLTNHRGQIFTMPINLGTICQFYGRAMSPEEARTLIVQHSEGRDASTAKNLEDKAIACIGRPLYDAFIKNYTEKQWQTDPRDLPAEVIGRLPVRYNFDTRYFNDAFEGLPTNGYTAIFNKMLSSPFVNVLLNTNFFDFRSTLNANQKIVFTGPIDRYYAYSEGRLGWRTIDFEWLRVQCRDYQGASVINFADSDVPWTRVIEFKHFHPERSYTEAATLIAREYARFAGAADEPFYPVNTPADRLAFEAYRDRAALEAHVRFGGRLGTYKYLDMHQAISAALTDAPHIDEWLQR